MLTWSRSYSGHLFSSKNYAALQLLQRIFRHAQLAIRTCKLESQITNWSSYPSTRLGRLLCDDVFSTRNDLKNIHVFLFQHAILVCYPASEQVSPETLMVKSSNKPLRIIQYIAVATVQAVFRSCGSYYLSHLSIMTDFIKCR